MKDYIIVNNSTFNEFLARTVSLNTEGYKFTFDYAEKLSNMGATYPGGFGCLRMIGGMPAEKMFLSPDVEYRYSDTQNKWLADGQETNLSKLGVIQTLYEYFVTLEGHRP
jgi:hypothetical protein